MLSAMFKNRSLSIVTLVVTDLLTLTVQEANVQNVSKDTDGFQAETVEGPTQCADQCMVAFVKFGIPLIKDPLLLAGVHTLGPLSGTFMVLGCLLQQTQSRTLLSACTLSM